MPNAASLIDISKRPAKLESWTRVAQRPRVRLFAIEGRADMPEGAAVSFLCSCGHDIRDEDHTIVRAIIGAQNGRPIDLPLCDVTAECGR